MNLLLLTYNNYFNRIVRRENSVSDYLNASANHFWVMNVNGFNPNDGITAEQIVNFPVSGWDPDYLLAVDEGGSISSRWFVTESVRTRNGQYKLTLKRDSISDYFDEVTNSPCYIEKAVIKDRTNPLVFNDEGMRLNQIKKDEILLKDNTRTPWIVGYLARTLEGEEEMDPSWSITAESTKPQGASISYNSLPADLKAFIEGSPLRMPYRDNVTFSIIVNLVSAYKNQDRLFANKLDGEGFSADNSTYLRDGHPYFYCAKAEAAQYQKAIDEATEDLDAAFSNSAFYQSFGESFLSKSEADLYEGKTILKDGKEYRLEFVRGAAEELDDDILSDDTDAFVENPTGFGKFVSDLRVSLREGRPYWAGTTMIERGEKVGNVKGRIYRYTAKLVSISTNQVSVSIDNLARRKLIDAPYDMFCIPMDDLIVYTSAADREGYEGSDIALAMARAMKTSLGNWVYDIQVLPYLPMQGVIVSNKSIEIYSLTEHADYEWIKDANGNRQSIMLFPVTSQGTLDITVPSTYEELKEKSNPFEAKVFNETTMVRLCSPNYNGEYQFSPQKNGGALKYNVDFNYRPYNPYIHVAPVFGGLYGRDFNDARGLICGGDFSISMVDSAWTQYQINNKNFQNIFDRQIENMDLNNSIAKQEAGFSIAAGTLQGTMSGATSGFFMGGGYGAIAGAVVGGAASLGGGLLDYANLEKRMAEAKDYKIDMYNYGLGNIKALPYTLTKVSSINENNKLFPFIEIYSCTDKERRAFENKIKYGGMTVMEISTIADYLGDEPTYVKGEMIRVESIPSDKHLLDDIYTEVAKGLFI